MPNFAPGLGLGQNQTRGLGGWGTPILRGRSLESDSSPHPQGALPPFQPNPEQMMVGGNMTPPNQLALRMRTIAPMAGGMTGGNMSPVPGNQGTVTPNLPPPNLSPPLPNPGMGVGGGGVDEATGMAPGDPTRSMRPIGPVPMRRPNPRAARFPARW